MKGQLDRLMKYPSTSLTAQQPLISLEVKNAHTELVVTDRGDTVKGARPGFDSYLANDTDEI